MKIPEQVINSLAGKDVILVPPQEEGTTPTPAEEFVQAFIEPLMMLEMGVAVQEDGSALLFNPSYHDPALIEQAAQQGRLAEYVNGAGNNQKPVNPMAMVKVTSKKGEPVRDILVDSLEKADTAARRNMTDEHNVEVVPASNEELASTLANRAPAGTMPEQLTQR